MNSGTLTAAQTRVTETDRKRDTLDHHWRRDAVVSTGRRRGLLVALALSLVPYLFVTPHLLRGFPYVIQDDVRHYVVWLRRFLEPGLWPRDAIADQMSGMTPWLYAALFRPLAALDVDPLLQYVLVIRPATGLLFTTVSYFFIYQVWPSAFGAAIACVAMMVLLGVPEGLPHDFGFTMVMVSLLAFRARAPVGAGLAMAAASGLLPVSAMVAGVAMAMLMLEGPPRLVVRDRRAWATIVAAAGGAIVGVVPTVRAMTAWGPAMSAAEAAVIPFFGPDGWRPYFGRTFSSTYLCNGRAGITPLCGEGTDYAIIGWTVLVAAALGMGIFSVRSGRARSWLERHGVMGVSPRIGSELGALVVAGPLLFIVVHAMAFTLHLPNRVAKYSIEVAFAMVLVTAAAAGLLVLRARLGRRRAWDWVMPVVLATSFVAWAAHAPGRIAIERATAPAVFDFLRTTDAATVVAGIVPEIDNVPAFASRRVLVSMELLTSRQRQHFAEMRRRLVSFTRAMYASNRAAFAAARRRDGIDFVLVERDQATTIAAIEELARSFPEIAAVAWELRAGSEPFFKPLVTVCTRAEGAFVRLLDARCLEESMPADTDAPGRL